MEWSGYGGQIKVNDAFIRDTRRFINASRFSPLAPGAVLSNNSQKNKECLLNRHTSSSSRGQITSQKLRINDHNLSEQFSE